MPTAFDRLRRATSDLDTVDERAAIPCAAPSCDALFADSAMMTVLFHETEDPSGEGSIGKGSLFGGLLLGTAALAAGSAGQRRKRRPDVNRAKPATPRYSGKTIVFAE